MKLFLVLGAVALVHGQADSTGYFPGEPSCALPCLSSAIPAAGCQLSDIGCQCGPTQSAIASRIQGCIISSCTNPTDLGQAVNAGQAVCSSFFAGELSFTQPGGPAQTPTPVPGSSSNLGNTSVILTNSPTPSATSTVGTDSTSTESAASDGTHTDTLIGSTTTTPTDTLLPSTSATPGAAATLARLGAGALAGIMGAIAFF
ncbi:hypothetical protein GQX73_g10164 [Xylaria multiplex]|uniref:CFEM domain-containing protein n=1 Tax=Xylaria multiplex TaxID=323545 RepID=A0A7C8IKK5_9PEZI|nr:hypothetical protein GQX73_g10164 [Xylaria multiplex]